MAKAWVILACLIIVISNEQQEFLPLAKAAKTMRDLVKK